MNTIKTAIAGAAIAAAVALPLVGASAAFAVDATFPPTAVTDHYAAEQGVPLSIDAASGLLANDSDGGNAGLSVDAVTLSSGGTLVAAADGSFLFTPDGGFTGTAHFIYHDIASGFLSNSADVLIDVTYTPQQLVGAPDFYTTPKDTPFTAVGGLDDLLMNDPRSSYIAGIDDATGEITVNIYGQFTYTPAPGFVGIKTFSYYMDDDVDIQSDWVLVTIEVTAPAITIIPSNPIPHDPTIPAIPATDDGQLATLAYTGTDDATVWLIAPAAALLALGGLGVWLARRRAAQQ